MAVTKYTKTMWKDDQAPFIEASNLMKIEKQIYDLTQAELTGGDYTATKPTLLGTWTENPAFGECLVVKVGRTCTLSGWLIGSDPFASENASVLSLPTDCIPKRPIFVFVYTMGTSIPAAIEPESGNLLLLANNIEKPSISSDMIGFTVTYVVLDA